jgi:methyl acetate hydrolase
MKRLVIVLLILLAPLGIGAQSGAPAFTEKGVAEITAYLQDVVTRGEIPGMVALVVNRDRIIYHEAFGPQNPAKKVPMSRDTIFNIASMTKPVTSAATMMLVEEGKLRLDDEATKYLPALAKVPVLSKVDVSAETYETRPARRAMTIRHLLTNTSGIGYAFSNHGLALVQRKTKAPDPELPLVGEPGEQWAYGGSTRVLGDIIVKLTGRPLDQFLNERIFTPLAMRDTTYTVPSEKFGRVVSVHNRTEERRQGVPGDRDARWVEQVRDSLPPGIVRGDGGLYSTAADYAQFIRMFLNGGTLNGARVLSARSVRDMTRNQIGNLVVPQQPTTDPARSNPFPLGAGKDKWGLGFQLATTGDASSRSVGSYSWAGIFNTEFWVDPQKQIGAVLLMQTLPFYDERAIQTLRGFEQRVYRHLVLSSAPPKS